MLFQKISYRFGAVAMKLYAELMLKMDVSWLASLPSGPKILVANHPTTTDPFYLLALQSEPIRILVNQLAFDTPGFGRYLKAAGHVKVQANDGRCAFEEAVDLLKSGHSIGIFPEGALSPENGGVAPPRTGAARLALMSGAPIIPVGIDLDRTRIQHKEARAGKLVDIARWYIHGPYHMTVGEPVYLDGDVEDRDYVREASRQIMDSISHMMAESARRMAEHRETFWYTVRTWLPRRLLSSLIG